MIPFPGGHHEELEFQAAGEKGTALDPTDETRTHRRAVIDGQFLAALEKTDGDPTPPDFVAGPAAAELARMILNLLADLGGA